ncbi:MAG: TolC family protein [Saprospiraceae bacterium]|nr:TolC family protein [Saprospiraceae bacterium]
MKNFTQYLVSIILMIITIQFGQAQTNSDSTSLDSKTKKLLGIIYNLPPMEDLVDTAIANSISLNGKNQLIRVKQNELARIKNDWLNIFAVQGGLSYGNGSIAARQSNFNDVVLSNNSTVRFSIGISMSFSPSYWMERKNEINIRKAHLEYEKITKDEVKHLIRQAVINAYLALEFYREAFLVANAGYESNHATVLLAEKKFLEGDIDIALYNDIQLKHTKLAMEIEGYKRNLKKAFYDLEIAIGTPLANL